MQKAIKQLPEIKLVGITTRTNNASEMNPSSAKIGPTVSRYFSEAISSKIIGRTSPGVTYSVYTNYESDVNGDYTYFIGEEVSSFDEVEKDFSTLIIPVQNYAKFTTGEGAMPEVCINAWQKIWQMQDLDRAYIADFEFYDHRAADPTKTVLDLYIGIK